MDFLNATDPATLTASPQRVFKSRCYFCSSTNSCADHLPTAASTAVRTLNIAQTADSKPPTTAPTTPSRTSSICSPLRDGATSLLESSCLTSRRLESSMLRFGPSVRRRPNAKVGHPGDHRGRSRTYGRVTAPSHDAQG